MGTSGLSGRQRADSGLPPDCAIAAHPYSPCLSTPDVEGVHAMVLRFLGILSLLATVVPAQNKL